MNLKFTSTTLELGVVVTRFQLIKISEGPRGATGYGVPPGGTPNQILAKSTGNDFDTAWINQSAKITVSATAPSSPAVGDLWVDTS